MCSAVVTVLQVGEYSQSFKVVKVDLTQLDYI